MLKYFEEALFTRQTLMKFLESFSVEELNRVPPQFNNSIFWNIAHLLVTPQLICYRRSGLDLQIDEALVKKYAKGTKPDGEAEVNEIDIVKRHLVSSAQRIEKDYKDGLFQNYEPYMTSTGIELTTIEDALRFSTFHDGIHLGVILSLKKLV